MVHVGVSVDGANPLTASFLHDPYPLYRRLRDDDPVHCDTSLGQPIWLFLRHDDVSAALADWQTFSSVQSSSFHQSAFALRNREGGRQMIESDPPFHGQLRETVKGRYSPKRVRDLESAFRDTAAGLLADARPGVRLDIARDFAWRLTLRITGDMIGIPEADRSTVLGWYLDVIYSGSHEIASNSAIQYGAYFSELAAQRLAAPRDDLMSDLMRLVVTGDIERADAVLLCMDLFEGGVDVPANLIGNAVIALANHPEQRALLTGPDLDAGSLRIAIEELARFDTPIQYLPRVTTRDVTLHGVTIPKGSRVRLVLGSANRDERQYDEPDRLDLSRPPVRSVAFGVGAHFCIGAPLARLGLSIALPMLLRTVPDYRIAEAVDRPRGADIMRAVLSLTVVTGRDEPAVEERSRGTRVIVDVDRCESHGQCVLAAPTVFHLDDDLTLSYDGRPSDEVVPDVVRAAQLCPTQAIRVLS
jgi:cytochrome P450/ferredoxin